MLVTLGPDQEVLHDTTARFLDEQMPVSAVRALREDPAGFDPKYWLRGAELGWTALLVSEAGGGGSVSGDPLQDLCLIAYEFGTHAAPGPLVPVNIVASALDAAGGDAHAEVIGGLIGGELIASWAISEPAPGDGLGEVGLEITADGTWDGRRARRIRYEDITRIDVGGRYEQALHELGGYPPIPR